MNNTNFLNISSSVLLLVSLSGCAIGFDHTLFMTKSNVGVDIDTKAPTAEISIARRELVIAPAFEKGQTPPVLAGFRTGNRLLFGFDVSSVFAGGNAALMLSDPSNIKDNSELCLQVKPVGKLHLGPIELARFSLPTKGEIRPFVFGTDTTFGLKVAWSGMTAQFPDSLKIGFNRKELALAPVFGSDKGTQNCPYLVGMPPFLASIEMTSETATPQTFDLAYRQSFSTGSAAVELAKDPNIKMLLLTRMDRPITGTFAEDKNSICIKQWLESDLPQKKEKTKEINKWLEGNGHKFKSTSLIYTEEFSGVRAQFIKEKNIDCKGE
ncbi:hypothetical protein [Nitrosomonas ureae]|uniref:Lipoprotein n=1 Tax=Nitrosomonas ureae TaxID=44577 RepID=A0A1H2GD92_9PROT|nr:hypothetical protein [Nitrosomonas ureae]ALQ51721.1 hypothetical protein ATY38_11100 [Nitrosomonas ureae]SDU17494.1 hypothetical protein SAMN05216406_13038 [Nitrosomonas ureae]